MNWCVTRLLSTASGRAGAGLPGAGSPPRGTGSPFPPRGGLSCAGQGEAAPGHVGRREVGCQPHRPNWSGAVRRAESAWPGPLSGTETRVLLLPKCGHETESDLQKPPTRSSVGGGQRGGVLLRLRQEFSNHIGGQGRADIGSSVRCRGRLAADGKVLRWDPGGDGFQDKNF